ncbi:hypothetical protein C5B86_13105 [Haloferax sp. Atlit-19N]|uniref:hypothetical protein n=1 Tax=Haloferax sp. Atlit-19N TaxID=2077201 RepID=UPI000E277A32|nr:hypothetical protein [Haloferax sp. Atlit-19N]RDZ43952.1 hypothetical protein C5B86_13105 [Haloferax sp. Atlit-19N]
MFETPASVQGYGPVVALFWVYVLIALGVTLGIRQLGLPDETTLYVFLGVGLVLLKPFVPLFKRYSP